MTDKETEELNRWCHEFLGRKIPTPEVCPVCNVTHASAITKFKAMNPHPYPDYTTDLNEATKVEAKAIETAGLSAYLDAVDAGLSSNDPTFGQSETIYIHQYLSLTALARCQASRAAVEGVL